MFRTFRRRVYRVKRTIRNLRDWLPIITKDEHWDFEYLYEILYKKLELKEKFFRSKYAVCVGADEVAEEIKVVKDALKRLMENDYIPFEEFMKDVKASKIKHDELRQKDKDIVFDGIKNNIDKWWD